MKKLLLSVVLLFNPFKDVSPDDFDPYSCHNLLKIIQESEEKPKEIKKLTIKHKINNNFNFIKNIIKKGEGFRKSSYICSGGQLTIGYGHVIKSNENINQLTEYQADSLLNEDIRIRYNLVKRFLPNLKEENQIQSILLFIYALGEGTLVKSSLYKYLKNNETYENDTLFSLFTKFCTIKGKYNKNIYKRRIYEYELFTGDTTKKFKKEFSTASI